MGDQNIFGDSVGAKNPWALGTGPDKIAALAGPTGPQKQKAYRLEVLVPHLPPPGSHSASKHAAGRRSRIKTEKVKSRFRFLCMLVRTPSAVSKR